MINVSCIVGHIWRSKGNLSDLATSHYIERLGGSGACLVDIAIQILLYADDIVLISNSPEGLQRHLNALKLFCTDKGLLINMQVMVFNTTQAWVTTSESEFFLGEEKVEIHMLLHIPRSDIYKA